MSLLLPGVFTPMSSCVSVLSLGLAAEVKPFSFSKVDEHKLPPRLFEVTFGSKGKKRGEESLSQKLDLAAEAAKDSGFLKSSAYQPF